MSSSEQDAEEQLFIERAHDSWVAIVDGRGAKVANKMTRANDRVARNWLLTDVGQQRLLSMLDHQNRTVRFAAAAYLLKSAHEQKAIAMLELLEKDPKGLIAPTCRVLLMPYRGGKLSPPLAQPTAQADRPENAGPAA